MNVVALKTAWDAYRKADAERSQRGLTFGKLCYQLRKRYRAQGSRTGGGFDSILKANKIPISTAYFWLNRYETEAGLKLLPRLEEVPNKPDISVLAPAGLSGLRSRIRQLESPEQICSLLEQQLQELVAWILQGHPDHNRMPVNVSVSVGKTEHRWLKHRPDLHEKVIAGELTATHARKILNHAADQGNIRVA